MRGADFGLDRVTLVLAFRVFTPDWGPRPWGWEPDGVFPAAAPIRGGCC
ncbi:MAG TPA: hypothetical protein VGV13_02275 [Methylomirabilota bacterium]|nr:hypothetical protein [Methylomirabilota bacterium]